jgi:hypothetical protein
MKIISLKRPHLCILPALPLIRIDGSLSANSGETFAIYVNGKLMAEQPTGVNNWRRAGQRGSHVWDDFADDFKGGPVTLAIAHFPMVDWTPGDWIPAVGPLSVWIETQKVRDLESIKSSSVTP